MHGRLVGCRLWAGLARAPARCLPPPAAPSLPPPPPRPSVASLLRCAPPPASPSLPQGPCPPTQGWPRPALPSQAPSWLHRGRALDLWRPGKSPLRLERYTGTPVSLAVGISYTMVVCVGYLDSRCVHAVRCPGARKSIVGPGCLRGCVVACCACWGGWPACPGAVGAWRVACVQGVCGARLHRGCSQAGGGHEGEGGSQTDSYTRGVAWCGLVWCPCACVAA